MGVRETQRVEQRARILDGARRLFADHGTDDVTMADVAAEAGVARATVFNHFGSKHALVEGITEEVLTHYTVMLESALADTRTPTTTLLRGLFEGMGRGIEDDRLFHRGVFREITRLALGLDEGGPGQVARQRNMQILSQLLARGQVRGEVNSVPHAADLANAIGGLVFGTITHWLYDDASEPLHQRMLRTADVFLGPVEIDPEARDAEPLPVDATERNQFPADGGENRRRPRE